MNAVTDLPDATFELLPLAAIAPSETPSQVRRRKRYSAEELAELAKSVASVGIMQPVIVRKLAALRGLATHELVAGERRWLAAEKAGLGHVPAIIRDVRDADLVAFQLAENLQRASVDPLQEAEAYRDIMADEGVDAETAGARVGKSRRHVYNRLKLLRLKHPAAIEALETGRIDQSKALLIARIPSMRLQLKALEIVVDVEPGGEPISYRKAAERLREKLMVRLDGVPFSLEDDSFLTEKPGQFACQTGVDAVGVGADRCAIPACIHCPNFSGADPEFQGEVDEAYGAGARVCTDRPCHDHKVKTFFARRIDRAKAAGLDMIEGEAARAVKPWSHSEELRGYVDLDTECQDAKADDDGNRPTFRELLGDPAQACAVLIDPYNKQPREVLKVDDAARLLKAKGIKLAKQAQPAQALPFASTAPAGSAASEAPAAAPSGDSEDVLRESEKLEARQEQERAFRRRLLELLHEKWKGPLKRDDLQAIADWIVASFDMSELPIYDWFYDGNAKTEKMNERDLGRFLLELMLCNCTEYLGDSPTQLLAIAKRLKIDVGKVKKQLKAAEARRNRP